MRGWKIALLAVMGGIGAAAVVGGGKALLTEVLPGRSGGEAGIAIGVGLLIGAALLYNRWRLR